MSHFKENLALTFKGSIPSRMSDKVRRVIGSFWPCFIFIRKHPFCSDLYHIAKLKQWEIVNKIHETLGHWELAGCEAGTL